MSIASPTLRSSSSTLPCPSCSSCATERCARPSTAEMPTGTSKTGARSDAVFSSPSGATATTSSGGSSSSFRSVFGSSAIGGRLVGGSGSGGGNQGFGVKALGGERALERFGDPRRGRGRIERGRAVAPLEHERSLGQRRIGARQDLPGVADRFGGLRERGLQSFGELRRRAQDQSGRRFHLSRERRERSLQRRLRKALAGRAGAVFVGGGGQRRQGGLGGGGEVRQRLRGLRVRARHRRGLALGPGGRG